MLILSKTHKTGAFLCHFLLHNDSTLEEFDGEADHVHLLITYPPRIALSTLVNSLKGVASRVLRKKLKYFKKNTGERMLHYGVEVTFSKRVTL